MYMMKVQGGWASDANIAAAHKNAMMDAISDITVLFISDVRAIYLQQGEGDDPAFYCETNAEVIGEGIMVKGGWAGYASAAEGTMSIAVHDKRTLVYFGHELVWFSTGFRLLRSVARELVNKYAEKEIDKTSALASLIQAHNRRML